MGSSRLACGVEGVAIPLRSSSSPAVDLRNQRVNGMVGSKMVLIDGLPLAGVGEKPVEYAAAVARGSHPTRFPPFLRATPPPTRSGAADALKQFAMNARMTHQPHVGRRFME